MQIGSKAEQAVTHALPAKAKEPASQSGAAAIAVVLANPVVVSTAAVLQQVAQYRALAAMPAAEQSTLAAGGVDKALPSVQAALSMPDTAGAQAKLTGESEETQLDQLAEPQSDSNQASNTEPYPLRQLHMIQNETGVRAWIRDAGLSQPQAYSVAQALSSELSNSGLKLNALVLNGKKLAGLFQGNKYQNHEILSIDQSAGAR